MDKDELPRRFGDYTLLDHLGEGGMGAVYLAQRVGFGDIAQLCVVKTIRAEYAAEERYRGRFADEARVVVQLNHRNVCHVSDVGAVDGTYYLAMEYIFGQSLQDLWEHFQSRGEPLPEDIAIYVILQVLEALDYAHRLKHPITGEALRVVHRDVSPHNIMVNFEGEVKLIDFGLAVSELKKEQTAANTIVGKLLYLAPEQANEQGVGPYTDIFSLGIVAYELLTGHRYYEELQRDFVIHAVLFGHKAGHKDKIDPALLPILERALNHEPKDRFQTCAEFRDALEDYVAHKGLRVRASRLREVMSQRFAAQERLARTRLQAAVSRADEAAAPVEGTQVVRLATALGPGMDTELASEPSAPPRPLTNPANLMADSRSQSRPLVRPEPTVAARPPQRTLSQTQSGPLPSFPTEPPQPPQPPQPAPLPQPPHSGSYASGPQPVVPPTAEVAVSSSAIRVVVVIALGLVACVAVILGLTLFVGAPEDPGPPVVQGPDLPVAPPRPPPTEPPAPPPATVDAGAPAPPPDDPVEPVVTEPTEDPDKPDRRRRRARKPPPPKVEAPPPPKVAVTNLFQALDYLDRYCMARVRCARKIVRQRSSLGSMDAAALASLNASARRCVSACQKPR